MKNWVFPGNTADVSTILTIKKDFHGCNLGRSLFVADSGMNCETNRKELANACGKYLFSKEVILENWKRYIICYNLGEARRQATHREDCCNA